MPLGLDVGASDGCLAARREAKVDGSVNRHARRRCSAMTSGAASGVPLEGHCSKCQRPRSAGAVDHCQALCHRRPHKSWRACKRARSPKLVSGSAKTPSRATLQMFDVVRFDTRGMVFEAGARRVARPRMDADCAIEANCGHRPRRDCTTSPNGAGTSSSESEYVRYPLRG